MLESPTAQARQAVVRAQLEARAMGHPAVESAHLLLGLVQEEEGLAGAVLQDADVTLEPVRRLVRQRFSSSSVPICAGPLSFAASAREVFASSLRIAFAFDAEEVSSEHLLVAIVRLREQDAAQILVALDVNLDRLRFEIKQRALPRHEPGSVHGRGVPLSQTPWATDAPIQPDSPDRFTR